MKFKLTLFILALGLTTTTYAQETAATPLQISGSVDTYFKYDLNNKGNIKTSFANDQNSVSLGMIDLALKKTTGKAIFILLLTSETDMVIL